jgi:hypothetical protein
MIRVFPYEESMLFILIFVVIKTGLCDLGVHAVFIVILWKHLSIFCVVHQSCVCYRVDFFNDLATL